MKAKHYAVKYNGKWHIAALVLFTEYDSSKRWDQEPPCWCDYDSTAFICPWPDAEEVIALPGDIA